MKVGIELEVSINLSMSKRNLLDICTIIEVEALLELIEVSYNENVTTLDNKNVVVYLEC